MSRNKAQVAYKQGVHIHTIHNRIKSSKGLSSICIWLESRIFKSQSRAHDTLVRNCGTGFLLQTWIVFVYYAGVSLIINLCKFSSKLLQCILCWYNNIARYLLKYFLEYLASVTPVLGTRTRDVIVTKNMQFLIFHACVSAAQDCFRHWSFYAYIDLRPPVAYMCYRVLHWCT